MAGPRISRCHHVDGFADLPFKACGRLGSAGTVETRLVSLRGAFGNGRGLNLIFP